MCGIRHKAIQRRLLQDPALTFAEAMKVALAAEAADKDAQRLTVPTTTDKDRNTHKQEPPSTQETPVHKVAPITKGKPQQYTSGDSGKSDCYRCGGKHCPSTCPCRQLECHFFARKKDTSRRCAGRKLRTPAKTRKISTLGHSPVNPRKSTACSKSRQEQPDRSTPRSW